MSDLFHAARVLDMLKQVDIRMSRWKTFRRTVSLCQTYALLQ